MRTKLTALATSSLILPLSLLFAGCATETSVPDDVSTSRQAVEVALTTQVNVISSWEDGYCAQIQVANESSAPVSPWTVLVNTNATSLTTVWSATGTLESGVLTVNSADYNAVLAAGASTEFGFCVAGASGDPEVTQATGGGSDGAPEGVALDLQLVNEWETGYCMNLTVTNTGDSTTSTWYALVDLADSEIVDAWNTSYALEGSGAALSPMSYNAVLTPGASTTAGFCGVKGESGELPTLVGDDGGDDDGGDDDGGNDDGGGDDDGGDDDGGNDDGGNDDGGDDDDGE